MNRPGEKSPGLSSMKLRDEDEFRIRNAKEFLADCQRKENEARRALAEASATTKRAREKFESLFLEVEAREVARRKSELK
jgi:hypothetical protein